MTSSDIDYYVIHQSDNGGASWSRWDHEQVFYPDEKREADTTLVELVKNNPEFEFKLVPVRSHRKVAERAATKERERVRGLSTEEIMMIIKMAETTAPVATFQLREKLQKELAERNISDINALYAARGGKANILAPSPELQSIEKRKKRLDALAKVASVPINADGKRDPKALLAALGIKKV